MPGYDQTEMIHYIFFSVFLRLVDGFKLDVWMDVGDFTEQTNYNKHMLWIGSGQAVTFAPVEEMTFLSHSPWLTFQQKLILQCTNRIPPSSHFSSTRLFALWQTAKS